MQLRLGTLRLGRVSQIIWGDKSNHTESLEKIEDFLQLEAEEGLQAGKGSTSCCWL